MDQDEYVDSIRCGMFHEGQSALTNGIYAEFCPASYANSKHGYPPHIRIAIMSGMSSVLVMEIEE